MRVLVVNAGSSTLKLTLLDAEDDVLEERELASPHSRVDPGELRAALGSKLRMRTRSAIASCTGASASTGRCRSMPPWRPSCASWSTWHRCTSRSRSPHWTLSQMCCEIFPPWRALTPPFTTTMPAAARTYALPASWRERWGLRRYGFHGLSHAWVARRTPAAARASRADCGSSAAISAPGPRCARSPGALGRHDDGIHAPGGSRHGDPLGKRRSRACCCGSQSASALRERAGRCARASLGPLRSRGQRRHA